MPFGCTLTSAIQKAGGETEFGNMKRVRVYRDVHMIVSDLTNREFESVMIETGDYVEILEKNVLGR